MPLDFSPNDYGPTFAPLLSPAGEQPLDAATPQLGMAEQLRELTLERAFAHTNLMDHDLGSCCLAGVWLLYNFLDEAHQLCQDVPQSSGSYWHGVMHRREGDFGNAKYWFRQAGSHPAGETIAKAATEIESAALLASGGEWDACGFVDLCSQAIRGGEQSLVVDYITLQAAEWRAMFDWCYQNAVS